MKQTNTMSILEKKKQRKQIFRLVEFAITIAGILLSAYMWYLHSHGEFINCSISSCEDVLTGEYSVMFGIPVAAFGMAYYMLLSLLIYFRIEAPHKKIENFFLGTLAIGVLYTLYLRYLEFGKIGGWCQWCWVSVIFIATLVVLYWREYKLTKTLKTQKEESSH